MLLIDEDRESLRQMWHTLLLPENREKDCCVVLSGLIVDVTLDQADRTSSASQSKVYIPIKDLLNEDGTINADAFAGIETVKDVTTSPTDLVLALASFSRKELPSSHYATRNALINLLQGFGMGCSSNSTVSKVWTRNVYAIDLNIRLRTADDVALDATAQQRAMKDGNLPYAAYRQLVERRRSRLTINEAFSTLHVEKLLAANDPHMIQAKKLAKPGATSDPHMLQAQQLVKPGASSATQLKVRRVLKKHAKRDPRMIRAQQLVKPGASAKTQLTAYMMVKKQDKKNPLLIRALKLLEPGAPASTQMTMCTVLTLQDEKDPHMIQAQAAYPRLGPHALMARYYEIKNGKQTTTPKWERTTTSSEMWAGVMLKVNQGGKTFQDFVKDGVLLANQRSTFYSKKKKCEAALQSNKRYKESAHPDMKPGKKSKV